MKKAAILVLAVMMSFACVRLFSAEEAKKDEAKKEEKVIKYSGMKSCVACHSSMDDAPEIWKGEKHAKAYETLGTDEAKKLSKDPQKDPVCLACHTTGYGKEGGYALDLEDKKKEALQGVTCEACHAPGADYNKVMMKAKSSGWKAEDAAAAGLILKPEEKTCLGCHNDKSPSFDKEKPFEFDKMKEQIAHGKKLEKKDK